MTDLAAEFRAMYLAHCEDCERAGLPMPTPEEWVDLLDDELRERMPLKWHEYYKREWN